MKNLAVTLSVLAGAVFMPALALAQTISATSPLSNTAPLRVEFTIQVNQAQTQYWINFGDGQESAGIIPCPQAGACAGGMGTTSHAYAAGTFYARLFSASSTACPIVTGCAEARSIATTTIIVAPSPTTITSAALTFNGSTSLQDVDPLARGVWSWSSTYSDIRTATVVITGCQDPANNVAISSWTPWTSSNANGTDALGSTSEAPGMPRSGCTVNATYTVTNSLTGARADAAVVVRYRNLLPGGVPLNRDPAECVDLQYNLGYRSTDAGTNGSVSLLQDFLQSEGYLASEPTGYFGLLTYNAVKSFQSANGILNSGYVGSITRAKVKDISCNGTTTTTSTTQTTTLTLPIGCRSGDLFNSLTGQRCVQTTPPPNFSVSPTSGPAPLPVNFSYPITADNDNSNSVMTVNFGDGTSGQMSQHSIGAPCSSDSASCPRGSWNVFHTYTSAGTYTARLLGPGCDSVPGQISCLSVRPVLGTVTITVGGQLTGTTATASIDQTTVASAAYMNVAGSFTVSGSASNIVAPPFGGISAGIPRLAVAAMKSSYAGPLDWSSIGLTAGNWDYRYGGDTHNLASSEAKVTGGAWSAKLEFKNALSGQYKVLVFAPCANGGFNSCVPRLLASKSVTITPAPAPTLTLWAALPRVNNGGIALISFSSTNADSCTRPSANGFGSAMFNNALIGNTNDVVGNFSYGPIYNNTSYTVTCTGPGGTVTKSVTVAVTGSSATAPTASLTITGPSAANVHTITLKAGDANTKTWSSSGGTSWSSTYLYSTVPGATCSSNGANGPWGANTASGGTVGNVAKVADIGCAVTITYNVRNDLGQTASDSIHITVVAATAPPGTVTSPSTAECTDLQNDLSYESRYVQTNGEVSLLQAFLQSAISPATGLPYADFEPTGFFGQLTRAAVIQFQTDNGLPALGLVGRATRAKVKELSCGNVPPPPPQTCNPQVEFQSCAGGAYAARIGPNCSWALCPFNPNPFCTADAMVCSDGTTVGRVPPNCAFAPCGSNSSQVPAITFNGISIGNPPDMTVASGTTVHISWNVTPTTGTTCSTSDGTSVLFNQSLNAEGDRGPISKTTTFSITCTNLAGSTTKMWKVNVGTQSTGQTPDVTSTAATTSVNLLGSSTQETRPGPTVDLTQSRSSSYDGIFFVSWNSTNADSCKIAYSKDGLTFTDWKSGTSGNNVPTFDDVYVLPFEKVGSYVIRATCIGSGNSTPAVDKVYHSVIFERQNDTD